MKSKTSVIFIFGAVVLFAGTPILTDRQALAISAIHSTALV